MLKYLDTMNSPTRREDGQDGKMKEIGFLLRPVLWSKFSRK
jgi:hypothetical protein